MAKGASAIKNLWTESRARSWVPLAQSDESQLSDGSEHNDWCHPSREGPKARWGRTP